MKGLKTLNPKHLNQWYDGNHKISWQSKEEYLFFDKRKTKHFNQKHNEKPTITNQKYEMVENPKP